MLRVKHTNVAGTFYPNEPNELKQMLHDFIHHAKHTQLQDQGELKALIIPHAGYIYSGSVAGAGYKQLLQLANKPSAIAILSPSHYFEFNKVAVLNCNEYKTPLGSIKTDEKNIQNLIEKKLAFDLPQFFEMEHALEVHLPFIQYVTPAAKIIPLIVGQTHPEKVEQIVEELINRNIFIIVSSDLSHFHSYTRAQNKDRQTQKVIENMDYQRLNGEMACGVYPLAGLLKWAGNNSGKIKTISMKNSGDTSKNRFRVVGYGSFALLTRITHSGNSEKVN